MKNRRDLYWLLIPLLLSPVSYAHAYIDPGTGSYVIQLVIASLVGATYALRKGIGLLIARVRSLLRKKKDD